jgi:hypothetical protein
VEGKSYRGQRLCVERGEEAKVEVARGRRGEGVNWVSVGRVELVGVARVREMVDARRETLREARAKSKNVDNQPFDKATPPHHARVPS